MLRAVSTQALILSEIETMPFSTTVPLYVVKETSSNSKIIEIISFDTTCWGYIRGFVCKNTIHDVLPADSLIQLKKKFFDEQRSHSKRKTWGPSSYGFYCKYCERY